MPKPDGSPRRPVINRVLASALVISVLLGGWAAVSAITQGVSNYYLTGHNRILRTEVDGLSALLPFLANGATKSQFMAAAREAGIGGSLVPQPYGFQFASLAIVFDSTDHLIAVEESRLYTRRNQASQTADSPLPAFTATPVPD